MAVPSPPPRPTVRVATRGDLAALERLWRDFEREVPPAEHDEVDVARELAEIAEIVAGEIALVAEDGGGEVVGFALARRAGARVGTLTDLYVVPGARNGGVAHALVREVVDRFRELGLDAVKLEVVTANTDARAVYARWGFREEVLTLVAPLEALAARLEDTAGVSTGTVYVQTDDVAPVERAALAFAPRIGSPGGRVDPPADGWTAVRDPVASGDPAVLRRLARELSERLGAVVLLLGIEDGAVVRLVALERGAILDEYLSVPDFHGPLPPGDVVALSANATVLGRLTGGDPASIRRAARTASSPDELPPAAELAASIAAALGLPMLEG